jgi:hypothetical protein
LYAEWLIVAFVVVVGWISSRFNYWGMKACHKSVFLEVGHFGLITPIFWLIKSRSDEVQKTELMGYHPSCFSKKTGFLVVQTPHPKRRVLAEKVRHLSRCV